MKRMLVKSQKAPVKKKPKVTDGPIRNVSRTKDLMLDAFGEILAEKDLGGITYPNIMKKSKKNTKLIYEYFGGLPQLINAYEKRQNFSEVEIKDQNIADRLIAEFDTLCENDELQGNIYWSLNQRRKKTADKLQERFSKVIDDGNDENRLLKSLLMGGLIYLAMYSKIEGRTICGIDVSTEEGKNLIKESVRYIFRTD